MIPKFPWAIERPDLLVEKLEKQYYNLSKLPEAGGPNDEQIRALDVSFIESKEALVILKPSAQDFFGEAVLRRLKYADTIERVRWHPIDEDPNAPAFDFHGIGPLLNKALPQLKEISLRHFSTLNFKLDGLPRLEELDLTHVSFRDNVFELSLPGLKAFSMSSAVPPPKAFAKSMSKCPRLEWFFAHKYWTNLSIPTLYLPSCKSFVFRRGGAVSKLRVYIPRCERLILDGNHSLTEFEIKEKGKATMRRFNMSPDDEQEKFTVSLLDARLSGKAFTYIKTHHRVRRVEGEADEEEEDEDFDDDGLIVW